ncbi:MAG: P-loop NTPase [Planctomycetes bacterium]|nr:P-loop NTPase [Planctomycetota bacterium]
MIDQATELRKLVLRAMREQPIATGPPPRLIVLTGGKGGVGVTTIAVNLSVALAEQGSRVVIVDGNSHRSDVATLCGLSEYQRETDLSEARHDIHEALRPGPSGIQIVPGLSLPTISDRDLDDKHLRDRCVADISYERLQRQLATLGRHADVVILDLGSSGGELTRRFTPVADDVLLVTTPDNVAVMDAYARIKTDLASAAGSSLGLVVNLATGTPQGVDVHHRVNSSCQKFLGTTVHLAATVPQDGAALRGAACNTPFVLGEPTAIASRAINELARCLVATAPETRTA